MIVFQFFDFFSTRKKGRTFVISMTLFLWHAKKHKGSQVATTATTTTTTAATTMLRVHPSGSVSVYYVLTNISLYYEANDEHGEFYLLHMGDQIIKVVCLDFSNKIILGILVIDPQTIDS